MTFGFSSMISNLFKKEIKSGKSFKIIVVDNYPFNEGRIMNEELVKAGVPCVYTLLNSATKFMPKVNKIIVGASSVLVNGYCLSRIGTAMVNIFLFIDENYRFFCKLLKFFDIFLKYFSFS